MADIKKPVTQKDIVPTLFTTINQNFDKHKEDDYVDFYTERNIPFMLSKQGPKAAVGDVDGDGLEDIFIGGAFQQPSQLYLQKANGFTKKPIPDFEKFSFNDVTTAFFFDADKDGDLDLFIGGGGNMAPASADAYQNQFYKNDGKGNFTLQPGTFGISHTNCGTAIPMDYDGDGYPDIFIGSRSEPQQYGVIPRSFIFHNNRNGAFEDVTAQVAPFLNNLGMVTSAVYADINGDAQKELIITGDYMGVQAFSYVNKKFVPLNMGLEKNYGWWQQIKLADLDGDGDLDMVLGNKGENFYLHPTAENPIKIWIKDFDQNGTIDKVFTQGIGGRDMPVFMKKDITDQLPSLKKSNLKHVDYAAKSIQDLFGKDLESAQVQQVNTASSMIAINDGKGNFTLKPLPVQAQLSSVYSIIVKDFNADGKPDLLLAGNEFDLLPQFCRLDGNYGTILINEGKNNFSVMPQSQTGLFCKEQIRDIVEVMYRKEPLLLILQNNNTPLLVALQSGRR